MPKIDNRDFVVCYMNSDTIDELAKAMNITRQSAVSKIYGLKKAGVNLPKKFKKNGLSKLDIAQLNSLILKHQKDQK